MYSHFSRFSRSSGNPVSVMGRGSLSRGVSVKETLLYSKERTVGILLECILVQNSMLVHPLRRILDVPVYENDQTSFYKHLQRSTSLSLGGSQRGY